MNTCESCDFFRKANTEGGTCHLNPPRIFMIPLGPAPESRLAIGGAKIPPGMQIGPASFFPAVRVSDCCAHHPNNPPYITDGLAGKKRFS